MALSFHLTHITLLYKHLNTFPTHICALPHFAQNYFHVDEKHLFVESQILFPRNKNVYFQFHSRLNVVLIKITKYTNLLCVKIVFHSRREDFHSCFQITSYSYMGFWYYYYYFLFSILIKSKEKKITHNKICF